MNRLTDENRLFKKKKKITFHFKSPTPAYQAMSEYLIPMNTEHFRGALQDITENALKIHQLTLPLILDNQIFPDYG